MIGPWQLLALRENETAMDVSSAAIYVGYAVVMHSLSLDIRCLP